MKLMHCDEIAESGRRTSDVAYVVRPSLTTLAAATSQRCTPRAPANAQIYLTIPWQASAQSLTTHSTRYI